MRDSIATFSHATIKVVSGVIVTNNAAIIMLNSFINKKSAFYGI